MKYLFINSVAGFGSTGRLAAEQCRELTKAGHACVLAFGREEVNCQDIRTVRIGTPRDYKLHGLRCRLLDDHGFGSKAATEQFLAWVREYDPDVIWLHNIHGYYIHIGLLFGYLRTCGKKIYWTLHDCWSFTGHCTHFTYIKCDKWKTGCKFCPQKDRYPKSLLLDGSRRNYRRKKALFTGIPNLTIIVPSQWLKSRVEESFLKDYPLEVRYNRVDPEVFKPTPSKFRNKHGFQRKKIVLGVASVWDDRKGIKDMVALWLLLPKNYRMVLVGLSPAQIKEMPKEILALPRTNSMKELAQIYTAADVYVSPSTEESFGMTTLEAISCGTPAVVYQGTACEEVVQTYGGIAVPRGPDNLLKAILKLTKERYT
ncbi:MAG: glycosyltransferase [Eubacteriales bacterium]|nr:glycosyltransferase [Eubacteriales bacterium]